MNTCFLSTAYLPTVSYLALIYRYDAFILEQHENYRKQSWRNRCAIAGPNNVQVLSIPVDKEDRRNVPIRDLKISNAEPWQRLHWRSVMAAYNNAPFFLFYRDSLEPFYTRKFKFLFDFNEELLLLILRWLKIGKGPSYTETFLREGLHDADFRFLLHPKLPDPVTVPVYHQVFAERTGFIPGLSVLDLICNHGPESIDILRNTRSTCF